MIKIITGRQTDSLQTKILDEAINNYQKHPERQTFIIVPNHIKFTTEVKAISQLAVKEQQTEIAVQNLQVLSFSRLAWYFLKDEQIKVLNQLDDAAASMLLTKIIEEKKGDLKLLENINLNSGIIKQIYDAILQIYEGNLDLDNIDLANLENETQNKIHDLRLIYDEFINKISGKFFTKNDTQLKLNEFLVKNKELKEMSFYFCDFSHFSLQESLTVKLLLKHSKNMTMAFKTKLGEITPKTTEGDYDFVIQRTITSLLTYLQEQEIDYQTQIIEIPSKLTSRDLLNGVWTQAVNQNDSLDQVQLVKADSRYSEAYFVARTIYQQVALKNYRYQDFLILAPNLHEYETYLTPILRQNEIPFFNDLQQEMKYHPLVVVIESLAKLIQYPLQTQEILTILKSRLVIPEWYQDVNSYMHDIDLLENFVLAHGINHNLWKLDFNNFIKAEVIRLDKKPNDIERINRLRVFIVEKITNLIDQLSNEKDSQKAITIFFNFLVNNGISKQLDIWRKDAQEAGDLQLAQQPEQLWNLLIQLLKDYLLINPNEFKIDLFFNMLNSAFKEANFSQIPSTLDAVNISELGMVQADEYKQVFIIGATSTNLPKMQKTPSFLNSENIEQLSKYFSEDAYIEDRQNINNLDQDYQFGLALALATDKVYISYPILNASNEELEPSIFYNRLKNNHAPEMVQHDLPENIQELLSFITNSSASLGYLSYLNSINESKAINELIRLAKKTSACPQKVETILEASQFDNTPLNISEQLAQELYGQNLNASISQFESYYKNSYEYFLNYGLHLRKRFENEFDVVQAGNYFHETFDRLTKTLKSQNTDLSNIDQTKLSEILGSIQSQLKTTGIYGQLMTDPFNQYLFTCLDKTTAKVVSHWQNTLSNTPMRAKYSELAFGGGQQLRGLNYNLTNLAGNHTVSLRGKIDRVDLARLSNKNEVIAQVIDYKSSAKKFDLGLFYQGISMQMISYLDILKKNKKFFTEDLDLNLFGAFYQTITRQNEKLNKTKLFDSKHNLKLDQIKLQPELLYNGIICNNPDLVTSIEPALHDPSTSSSIYKSLKSKSKGGFSFQKDRNFSEDEFDLLLEYNELLIKTAAEQILSGQIKLNPYKYGNNETALSYSDYRDIFFFDAMLSQNSYHEIENLSKKELLKRIQEKLKGELK